MLSLSLVCEEETVVPTAHGLAAAIADRVQDSERLFKRRRRPLRVTEQHMDTPQDAQGVALQAPVANLPRDIPGARAGVDGLLGLP